MTDTQLAFPSEPGFLNPESGTWHYLRRCAGGDGVLTQKKLSDAVVDGHDLCGVCCARFAWYERAESREEKD
jgi:hypothetical protein